MEKRKYHAISWDMLAKHKDARGLRLRKHDHMNNACFMKLI